MFEADHNQHFFSWPRSKGHALDMSQRRTVSGECPRGSPGCPRNVQRNKRRLSSAPRGDSTFKCTPPSRGVSHFLVRNPPGVLDVVGGEFRKDSQEKDWRTSHLTFFFQFSRSRFCHPRGDRPCFDGSRGAKWPDRERDLKSLSNSFSLRRSVPVETKKTSLPRRQTK